MASGHVLSSSDDCLDSALNKLDLHSFQLEEYCPMSTSLIYEKSRLKWLSDFDSLKKFMKESIGLRGKWSTPGGSSKQFKGNNVELVLTWYHKKQKTLLFQGNDGNLLKEKLIKHCETTAPSQEATTWASSSQIELSFSLSPSQPELTEDETVVQPLGVESVDKVWGEGDSTRNDNDCFEIKSSPFDRCDCPCRTLATELEGVKLDIVILQKRMEYKASSYMDQSVSITQSSEEMRLKRELSEEKDRNRQLEKDICVLVKGRDAEMHDLNNTINSLEDRVIKAEGERDSLRLALSLIMQEKQADKVVDANATNKWRTVGVKVKPQIQQGRKDQLKTKQETTQLGKMGTDYRRKGGNNNNSFAVLKDYNYQTSNNDNHFDEVKEVKSTRTESPKQSRESVVIIGDSMVKGLQANRLKKSTELDIKVKAFPGSTVSDMHDYMKPSLKNKPDRVIIHVGTNNLKRDEPAKVVDEIKNLVHAAKKISPKSKIAISEIITREDDMRLADRAQEVNAMLSHNNILNSCMLISHENINKNSLNSYGLHLNRLGCSLLAKNFIGYLKSF